jgi:hypothetical protein
MKLARATHRHALVVNSEATYPWGWATKTGMVQSGPTQFQPADPSSCSTITTSLKLTSPVLVTVRRLWISRWSRAVSGPVSRSADSRLSGIRVDSFPAGANRRAPTADPAAKSPASSSVSNTRHSHRAVGVPVIHPAKTLTNTVASSWFPTCRLTEALACSWSRPSWLFWLPCGPCEPLVRGRARRVGECKR